MFVQQLQLEDWFDKGHGKGTFIWTEVPAAAKVVVEQLRRARLKSPQANLDAFW
jgi:hypothetical protein